MGMTANKIVDSLMMNYENRKLLPIAHFFPSLNAHISCCFAKSISAVQLENSKVIASQVSSDLILSQQRPQPYHRVLFSQMMTMGYPGPRQSSS